MTKNNLSPMAKCLAEIKERLTRLETQIVNHLNEHKLLSNRLFAISLLILSGIIGILVRLLIK